MTDSTSLPRRWTSLRFALRCVRVAAVIVVLPGGLRAQSTSAVALPRDSMQDGLPLRPTRTLTFTTKTGHWMSSDVSSDGKLVVFDILGDLYTLPITGGKATTLTRGMSFDAQPRFSPDGKRVVFVSDRSGGDNLWTISLDRKDTVQITSGNANVYESPIWTPDGKYIIATRGTRLWMFPAGGGTGTQLIRDSTPVPGVIRPGPTSVREEGPSMGKDPRYIWFAQRRGQFLYNSPGGDWGLMQYDRETGRTEAKENRWGSAFRPTVSPDGNWLVYGTRYVDQTRLRVRNLITDVDEWLTGPVQRDDHESLATEDVYPGMSFTPDSKSLITTWGGKLWKVAVATKQATEIPFEAGRRAGDGPARRVRVSHAGFGDVHHQADPGRHAEPRRQEAGVRRARPALRHGLSEWDAEAAHQRNSRGIRTRLEPRRAMDRLHHVERQHRVSGAHPQRRERPAAATHAARGYVDQSGLLTGRDAHCRDAFSVAGVSDEHGGRRRNGIHRRSRLDPCRRRSLDLHRDRRRRRAFQRSRYVADLFLHAGPRSLLHAMGRFRDQADSSNRRSRRPGVDGTPVANWARLSPDGEHALAQANLELHYIPEIPWTGGPAPTVTLGGAPSPPTTGSARSVSAQPFPTRRLTDIGGQFPAWGSDGNTIHWSIGNAHVVYDVQRGYRVACGNAHSRHRATRRAAGNGGPARCPHHHHEWTGGHREG
jgi:hypothetical protein